MLYTGTTTFGGRLFLIALFSIFLMGSTALSQSVSVTIPAGQTPNSSWSPWIYNLPDHVPSGSIITGIDLSYYARDQGWGGSGGWARFQINETTIGANQIFHDVRPFSFSYSGCLHDYVYGSSNQLRVYFYGYPGWQFFFLGGTMTIHYKPYESQPPVISGCPANITVLAEEGSSGAQALWTPPTASDNTSICSFTSNYNPGDEFPIGATQVVYIASDPSGNTAQCQFNVNIMESVTPTAVDDHFTLCVNNNLTFSDMDLLSNDSDPQGDPLKVEDISYPANGNLLDNGTGSYTYIPNPGFIGTEVMEYVIKKDDGYTAFPENNHFYEFVSATGITWEAAKIAAESRYYQGMQGYLVTITSANENSFVAAKLQGQGWHGASDKETEGIWKWVTGPEAGIHFSNQFKYGWCHAYTAPGINGNYANWQGGEPNDCGSGEDYAHYRTNGAWNDFPLSIGSHISGYVVEYGGLESTLPPLTATASIIIEVTSTPVLTPEVFNVSCFGAHDGRAVLNVTGGTAPLFYNWSTGATTKDLSGLAPGAYTVTVTDSKGCSAGASISITQPVQLTSSITAPPILCHGGSILKTNHLVSGGTEPYTFLWSNGVTQKDLSNVVGGTYSVTVIDANGCSVSSEIVLTDPPLLTLELSSPVFNGAYNIKCSGSLTGLVESLIEGGTPPYNYNWSNGSTGEDLIDVGTGTYSMLVTDANGCTISSEITLTEPPELDLSLLAYTFEGGFNISCNGNIDGTIVSTVEGGTAPYYFNWSESSTSADLEYIGAGYYSVTVSDANGCSQSADITLIEPQELTLTLYSHTFEGDYNISCHGNLDGTIETTVMGGTAPYYYTWSDGSTWANPEGLGAGFYSVIVSDANGCTMSSEITLTEPPVLTMSLHSPTFIGAYNISCYGAFNGLVESTVEGGTPPYDYSWTDGSSDPNLVDAGAGAYSLIVTDANGCSIWENIVLTEPEILVADAGENQMVFIGYEPTETTTLTALPSTGGTAPYYYQWYDEFDQPLGGELSLVVSPDESTVYRIEVIDANGCVATDFASVCVENIICTSGNGFGKGKRKSVKKVNICHIPPDNPANEHTICVSVNAVAEHLAEGDYLGECGTLQVCENIVKYGESGKINGEFSPDFILQAYPNPTDGLTNIMFNLTKESHTRITLLDLQGREIRMLYDQKVRASDENHIELDTQSLGTGIYLIKMITDKGVLGTLRLIVM